MNEMQPEKSKKIWKVGLIICLAGALIAMISLGITYGKQRQEQKMLEELANQVNTPVTETGQTENGGTQQSETGESTQMQESDTEEQTEPETQTAEELLEEKRLALEKQFGIEIPAKNLDFENLRETVNPDIYAWLYIPDSKIDFPLVQHPTDNSYYLKYNLDGSKGYPGGIYTENYNSKDFTDRQTVIYGHKVKGGFKTLHDYEDSEYFDTHRYIYIYTEDDILVYKVFGAYEFSNIHLVLSFDWSDDTIFQNYLEGIMEIRAMNSNMDTDMTFTADSKILTLSTCIQNKENGRYLVQGVLLNEDS